MKRPRFEVYKTTRRAIGGPATDEWRWRLVAANGRVLCSGEAHTRKADAERAVKTVRRATASCAP